MTQRIRTSCRGCWTQLAHLPGLPILLNDVSGPIDVVTQPQRRVLSRWVIVMVLFTALAGLMTASYLTSSELSSGVVVNREYSVSIKDIEGWTRNNYSISCPCSGLSLGTVDWAKVIPLSVWDSFNLMQQPSRSATSPELQAFCVGHALLGKQGDISNCRMISFGDELGLNTPAIDVDARSQILTKYPGSMLQAPTCRSIAGCLHHLQYSGFPSPILLSPHGLAKAVQAAMMGVIYSAAGQVQSQMMTRWSFNDMGGLGGNHRRLLQDNGYKGPDAASSSTTPASTNAYGPPEPANSRPTPAASTNPYGSPEPASSRPTPASTNSYRPLPQYNLPMAPNSESIVAAKTAAEDFNDAWNAFYYDTGAECNGDASCANEACVVNWFAQYVENITADYQAYYNLCSPEFCDVVQPKSAVTRVVNFLSTLGGLWGPLLAAALLVWHFTRMLPAMSPNGEYWAN